MATLGSLTDQLKKNNAENVIGHERTQLGLDTLNKSFAGFFTYIKKDNLDKLEDRRERKQAKEVGAVGQSFKKGYDKGLPFALGLPANLGMILASLAAAGSALAGLRGWEAKALANIDKLGKGLRALIPESIPKAIEQRFINLRASILRSFGLNPDLGKTDPETGKRSLKTPVRTQILEQFDKLKGRIFRAFGLGVDGKLITVSGPDGKAKVPTVGRITKSIEKLLTPVTKIARGIDDYILGPGAALFKFLGKFGLVAAAGAAGKATGAIAGFAKLAGKILWPIGVIFALFDGVKAYQEKEGSTFEKILAGAFGFIGDFIGAPLDLLKGAVSWLLRNALGVEVDEDGKVKPGQGLSGKVIEIINGFSFEKMIKAIPEFFEMIFEKITEFFNDPIGVGMSVVSNLYETIKKAFLSVIKGIVAYIPGGKKLFPELYAQDIAEANVESAQDRVARETRQYDSAVARAELQSNRVADLAAQIAELEKTGDFTPANILGGLSKDAKELRRLRGLLRGAQNMYKNSASDIETERAELAAAQAKLETARLELQNVINQTSVSTASQPIVVSPGQAWNPTDIMVQGAR